MAQGSKTNQDSSLFLIISRGNKSTFTPRSARTRTRWCPSKTVPSGRAFKQAFPPGASETFNSSVVRLRNNSSLTRINVLSACKYLSFGIPDGSIALLIVRQAFPPGSPTEFRREAEGSDKGPYPSQFIYAQRRLRLVYGRSIVRVGPRAHAPRSCR